MSHKISDLKPDFREMVEDFLQEVAEQGFDVIVTSTLRTYQEQADLYAIGRTKPGKKVTNAKPGQSWHNHGRAIDIVPLVNGKPVWNSPHWKTIGEIGEMIGMEWGGRWPRFKDFPHFQWTDGMTIKEAMKLHANSPAATD